tara:strand:+ start:27193 stop:27423 length:231 start_codon:yes stop_codon:yes gene_type:complete
MNTLTPELKKLMNTQNIDAAKGSLWKQQLKERKQHHMQSYLKVILLKIKTQDDCHATSNMSTQNLLRHLSVKYNLN